jgi:hypothetical protein
VVGGDHLDRLVQDLAPKVLHGHAGGLVGPLAAEIGVDAGLVVEDADLHGVARDLSVGGEGGDEAGGERRRAGERDHAFLRIRGLVP